MQYVWCPCQEPCLLLIQIQIQMHSMSSVRCNVCMTANAVGVHDTNNTIFGNMGCLVVCTDMPKFECTVDHLCAGLLSKVPRQLYNLLWRHFCRTSQLIDQQHLWERYISHISIQRRPNRLLYMIQKSVRWHTATDRTLYPQSWYLYLLLAVYWKNQG